MSAQKRGASNETGFAKTHAKLIGNSTDFGSVCDNDEANARRRRAISGEKLLTIEVMDKGYEMNVS
jgi:hypothetical protein